MTASNSILYDLYLDIKRGLSNKRFWTVLGIYSLIFLLHMILSSTWALTCYYLGGERMCEILSGPILTTHIEISRLTDLDVFKNYFPFIGATAYAYTIMDDRKRRYYMQQTQRVGFSRYYWCKLAAGSLLSGLLGALLMASICLLVLLFITYNPFIKGVVEYYSQFDPYISQPFYIGWSRGEDALITVINIWVWWLIGGMKNFLLGALYGLMASVLAFFTDNRVIMTACPILYFLVEDKWLYILTLLFGEDSYVSMILSKFYIRGNLNTAEYGNLYHCALLIFLIVLFLNLAKRFQNRAECLYMEGGSVSD